MSAAAAAPPLSLEPEDDGRFAFGLYEYDTLTGELWRGEEKLHLRPQAQQVLTLLLRRPGKLVSRDELREVMSGGAAFGAFDQAVNDAVREVRATLQDAAPSPRYVETLPRRGYRFVAEVRTARVPPVETGTSPEPLLPVAARRSHRLPWALALVAVVTSVAWLAFHTSPRRTRVLVLPVVNLGAASDENLAAGLTEELISQFGSLAPESLGAIGRTTAFRYQGNRRPMAEIRRELRVDYVVEGALRRDGARARIDVRLVEARNETTLWSQTLERDLGDVLALQADIAFAVSRRAGIALGPTVRRPPSPIAPEVAAAVLRARALWSKRSLEGLRQAAAELETALGSAPEHAPALALLAQILLTRADLEGEGRVALRARALSLADRALSLDDALADAHAAKGLAAMLGASGWRMADAERSLQRALTLNPSDAAARQWFSSLLRFRGRHPEALREARRALDLDPFSPSVSHNLANALLYAGDSKAAIAQYQLVLGLAPGFAPAQRGIGRALQTQGRLADALEAAWRARELARKHGDPAPEYLADVVYCLAHLGRKRDARAAARDLEAARADWPYSLAVAALALGERERTLELLEAALDGRDPQLRLLRIDPRLRALHGDQRFGRLLEEAGLADLRTGA